MEAEFGHYFNDIFHSLVFLKKKQRKTTEQLMVNYYGKLKIFLVKCARLPRLLDIFDLMQDYFL